MKLSVIIPVYNEANTITQVLKSLAKVSMIHEVVVVDDGSTDDTLGRLKRHFELTRTDMLHVSEIATEPVRAV